MSTIAATGPLQAPSTRHQQSFENSQLPAVIPQKSLAKLGDSPLVPTSGADQFARTVQLVASFRPLLHHVRMPVLKPVEATREQVVLRVTGDFSQGARFYQILEHVMAQLFPDERIRPRFLVDLQGDCKQTSDVNDAAYTLRVSKDGKPFSTDALLGVLGIAPQELDGRDPLSRFNVEVVKSEPVQTPALVAPSVPRVGAEAPVTIGVLGGMGPLAASTFLSRLTRVIEQEIPAATRERVRIVTHSNPAKPKGIGDGFWRLWRLDGRNVLGYLRQLWNFLGRKDVDFFVAPCNSFHTHQKTANWLASGRFKSLVDMVLDTVVESRKPNDVIAVLGTNLTIDSGLYRKAFQTRGIEVLQPDPAHQRVVDRAVQIAKQGKNQEAERLLEGVIADLHENHGATTFILGCTEMPLLVLQNPDNLRFIDTIDVLVHGTIRQLKQRLGLAEQPVLAPTSVTALAADPRASGLQKAEVLPQAPALEPLGREDANPMHVDRAAVRRAFIAYAKKERVLRQLHGNTAPVAVVNASSIAGNN